MNKRQRKKHGRSGRSKAQVTESSGNVFADLDLPNPEARFAEAEARIARQAKSRVERK